MLTSSVDLLFLTECKK